MSEEGAGGAALGPAPGEVAAQAEVEVEAEGEGEGEAEAEVEGALGEVCRLCVSRAALMTNMHELQHVAAALRLLTRLHIHPDDGLPNLICYRCLHELESYSQFRLRCITSDEKLRTLTGIFNNDVENSNSSDISHYDYSGLPEEHQPIYNNYSGMHHEETKPKTNDYVEDRVVMVVDPTMDYDSSDQSENEEPVVTNNKETNNEAENFIDDDEISHAAESFFKNVFMCQYCDRAFVTYQECKQHEQENHDPAVPYSCEGCSLVFHDRTLFIQHAKTVHGNDKPYNCTECDKHFGRRSDLRKHSIVHTGIRPYQCHYCFKSFSRNTNLSKHLRIHSGQKPFVCPHCPRSFVAKIDLDKHIVVHVGNKPFPCSKCPVSFTRKDKLNKHELKHLQGTLNKEEVESEVEENQQEDSNMVISLDPFSNLMTSPNQNISDGMELPSVPDHITGESTFAAQMPVTSSYIAPIIHNMQNTFPNQIQVQGNFINPMIQNMPANFNNPIIPNMAGNFNNSIIQNMPANFNNPIIQNMPSNFNNPMAQNMSNSFNNVMPQNINNFSNQLQNNFTNDTNMLNASAKKAVSMSPKPKPVPVKTMKPKNIKCHQCPKRFATLESYKSHAAMHMGIRNFECKVCSKRFAQKYELDRHSVTHTGYKPFACDQCDKTFTRKDKLKRHERTQHETMISSMPCIECGATFERKADLVAHIKSHFIETLEERVETEIKREEDSTELNVEDNNYYDVES